jgi:raffinose/stachyose/melibiose transport system permease protein
METGIAGGRIMRTPQQTRTRRRVQDNLTIILFLLPALVLFLTFVVYPIVQSAYYSLFDWKGLGKATDLIGLGNYAAILRDQVFLKAVRFTA